MTQGWHKQSPEHSIASKKGWIARRKYSPIKKGKVRIIDSRDYAPKPKIPRRIQSDITGETLKLQSKIGDLKTTKLYITTKNIPQEEITNITNAFQKLPQGVQNEIKQIDIHAKPGAMFKVGTKEFKCSGDWNDTTKKIRIFTDETIKNKINPFFFAEDVMTHEAGHALFLKLTKQRTEEEKILKDKMPKNLFTKLYDEYQKSNEIKWKEIHDEYDPKISTLINEEMKISDEKINAVMRDDYKEKSELDKKYKATRRKRAKLSKKMNKELEEKLIDSPMMQAEEDVDKKAAKIAPTTSALSSFMLATNDEGGITNYSDSYVRSKKPSAHTENFSECMKIWYSGLITIEESNMFKQDFPKTYKAFRALIEPETQGHYVTFNYKPGQSS